MIIKFKTIIIGAGISGCILGNSLKSGYIILEKNDIIGGEMNNVILGPKLYHNTKETHSFFKKYIKSTIKIHSTTLLDGKKCTNKTLYDRKIGYTFKNSQNSSKNDFSALKLDLKNFYSELNVMNNVKILHIDINNRLIYCINNKQSIIFQYNNLISTIDYKSFIDLCNLENKYNIKKRGVVYLNFNATYKRQYKYLNDYNFWYNLTNGEFFRCTNLGDTYTIELFVENLLDYRNQIDKYFNHSCNIQTYYNPNAKIWCYGKQIKYNALKKYNIYLLGRNALYNHDRIQDVIKNIEKIKEVIL